MYNKFPRNRERGTNDSIRAGCSRATGFEATTCYVICYDEHGLSVLCGGDNGLHHKQKNRLQKQFLDRASGNIAFLITDGTILFTGTEVKKSVVAEGGTAGSAFFML